MTNFKIAKLAIGLAVGFFGALSILGAAPAEAVVIANPTNSYSFPYLSGALVGGQQTQYIGETFTAPISGQLTDFQFTLNSSSLTSVYGIVYAWNGSAPTTELWRSPTVAGTAGLLDFTPTGVNVTAGQTYVAFLSTYGLNDNSGLATVGTCLAFVGCGSNAIENLGTLVYGNVYPSPTGVVFNQIVNNSQDATFSATISAAVPEPSTWATMIVGLAGVGALAARRRRLAAVAG